MGVDELREATIEKNSSALFTTETRSTREMHGEPMMPPCNLVPSVSVVKQDVCRCRVTV